MRKTGVSLLRAALCVLVASTLALSAGCSRLTVQGLLTGVIHPSIEPSPTQTGTRDVKVEFPFEDSRVHLSVPVDLSVYYGAVHAEKSAIFIGGERPPGWVSDYYRAFVDEEHQASFFTNLTAALHKVRDTMGLDSSRYIELVAAMAQNIEYRVDTGNLAPKFPIETFTDKYGDCDDKALLAAGVLAHDGYDVAVLFFGREEHVALGVKAPGLEYKDTGYAYVEMTEPSLVGVPPEKLSGNIELTSKPLVIPIGHGEGEYTAVNQIEAIREKLAQIRAEREQLGRTVKEYNRQLADERTSLDRYEATLRSAGASVSSGDINDFNRRVNEYNQLVARADTSISRYNALVNLERYASEHQNSRPQLYRKLQGQ